MLRSSCLPLWGAVGLLSACASSSGSGSSGKTTEAVDSGSTTDHGTTNDGTTDDSGDTADTAEPEADPLPATADPLVVVTGPSSGYDHATTADSVVLVGTAHTDTVRLTVDAGAGPVEVPVAEEWTSSPVSLAEGDNTLVVRANNALDQWQEVEVHVVRNPADGVGLSDVVLSHGTLLLDGLGELTAGIQLDGPADAVELWIDDRVAATLAETADGWWSGSTTVDTTSEALLPVRVRATTAGV